MVGRKQDMSARPVESIVVSVPLPAAAAHVDITSNNGNVEVDKVKRVQMDNLPTLEGLAIALSEWDFVTR